MVKHTNGPWVLDEVDWPFIISKARDDGTVICQFPLPVGSNGMDDAAIESIANARLAALAPELLDALTTMHLHVSTGVAGTRAHALRKSRKVLLKVGKRLPVSERDTDTEGPWTCEVCGKEHDNEFSRTCVKCDVARESGDLDLK